MPVAKLIAPTTKQEIPKLRVAAYCRVSSNSADQRNSFATQEHVYTKYIAEKQEWELVDIFADEGLSGMKADNRPEFQRMIRMCELHQIDLILTKSVSRFARNGKVGAITTVIAFFIGNSLMFFFGGISSVYVGGNDIFEVMINLGLFYLAILVLGLNIWTTNDNALYSAGLGLANIFGQRKKPMGLVSGIIGTVLSVWLYWNFTGWLNILNCTLPPVGIILVMSFFMDREKYKDVEVTENVNWFAVFGVVLGAVVANLVPWGIASINGMMCVIWSAARRKNKQNQKNPRFNPRSAELADLAV